MLQGPLSLDEIEQRLLKSLEHVPVGDQGVSAYAALVEVHKVKELVALRNALTRLIKN